MTGGSEGCFIVLEGGEAVGKTTQWKRIAGLLEHAGHSVVSVREPGGTGCGDAIRDILLSRESDLSAEAEALLFAASRAQLMREIIVPALADNKIVLVDRFLLSTYAYQGAGRGLSMAALKSINCFATNGVVPNLTLLLTMPVDCALERLSTRGDADRMERENRDFHLRVANAFLLATTREWQNANPEAGPVASIDASMSVDKVTQRCLAVLAATRPDRFESLLTTASANA